MTRQVSRTPVRFPSGVNTSLNGANPNTWQRMLGRDDLTRYFQFFRDFDTYGAGDLVITDVGTSLATALTDGDGGVVLITTGADNPSSRFFQAPKLMFYPTAGKQMWFTARWTASQASDTDIILGLVAQDTTPLANTDGLYFIKANGAATYSFVTNSASTATTASAIGTLTAATFVETSFYYDGNGNVEYFINNVKQGTLSTNVLSAGTTGLTPTFGIKSNSANARTLSIDYIWAIEERRYPNNP
jgi:hypothetical protein